MKKKVALLPIKAQLAPASTAVLPAGIYCNAPLATSFLVYDAFTDVGLKAAMNNCVATDPFGVGAVEATTGFRPRLPPPLGMLLLPPSNRMTPGRYGRLTMLPLVQWQVDPLCAMWAIACATAVDGPVELSLRSVRETCGAQRPWGGLRDDAEQKEQGPEGEDEVGAATDDRPARTCFHCSASSRHLLQCAYCYEFS